ncbi:MAG: MFS transporter [Anaerolineae bacterium]|jgi:predicted MFS family arabinose efflux permease
MTESQTPVVTETSTSARADAQRAATRRSAMMVIAATNFLLNVGYQLWRSLFNNFAVGELGVQADQIGLIQSVREVPGLLGFAVGMLAMVLTEMRIVGLSIVLLGLGIALTGSAGNLVGLMASTVLMSVGFHYFMPANSSAVLQLTGEDEAPEVLGRLTSLNALAALCGAGLVFLGLGPLGFRKLFWITGVAVGIGGLVALLVSLRKSFLPDMDPAGLESVAGHPLKRTPLRRRYWLYYTLQFLMGSRRHIFTTFAVFLLVREHGVRAETITVLYLVNNVIGTFLFRQLGKAIARAGEKRALTVNFLALFFVFLGYAYVPSLPLLYVLFVADHILFGFRIALQSYFQKIAVHRREITPNLSLGQTINHIASVIFPLVGGIIWETVGSRYTFLVGMGIVTVSLILVQWMHAEPSEVSPVTVSS